MKRSQRPAKNANKIGITGIIKNVTDTRQSITIIFLDFNFAIRAFKNVLYTPPSEFIDL